MSLATAIFLPGSIIGAESTIRVSQVGCPNISVASLETSTSFFTTVLDFKQRNQQDSSSVARLAPGMPAKTEARSQHLTLGDECLDLTEYTFPKGQPFPADSHGNDRWFQHIAIVISDMDKAYARLREARVQFVSNGPQTLPRSNKQAAGISAVYFRDPDGHFLELIHYPADKGQPKWHTQSSALFLGIDHTAIAVSDTLRSLAFYRDKLHFHIVGESENFGLEQEHLSGVLKAHVLITALRSDSGPGIELLNYLSPTSGRSLPNLLPNDIASWQIPIEVSISKSEKDIGGLHWQKLPANQRGTEAAWIKDPDGHLVQLILVGE